jgi:outer membrane receptor protein involved in Fe transport
VSTLTRILATLLFAAMAVGPASVATAYAAEHLAQAASGGTVSGTATSAEGAPIASATVTLVGPQTYTTTTDGTGAFSFSSVVPGIYRLTVMHPGYQTAQNDISVVAGQSQRVAVIMPVATFTSLRTIAHVSVLGRGTFNTTTAAVNTLSSVDFSNQGQYSVNHTLDQIPGLQISYPTSSANAASPGAIVVPNIRGGLSYETATLIDGHPLAVVDYGDYVTTFLNSFMFSSAEVVKGPGAMSPETNYAIGGTINFHTKDPTLTFTPDYTFGFISDGGTYWNLGVSDTVDKLGFVVDMASVDDPGLMHGQKTYFNPHSPGSVIGWNGVSGNVAAFNDSNGYLGTTESAPFVQQGLAACCYTYNGYFDQYADLFKLQYRFSSVTRATVSYLVTETYADQNANTASTLLPANFVPASGHGYSGSLMPGTQFWETSGGPYPGSGGTADETNDEPILQAEITTALGDNTLLARYYHADVNRLIDEGTDSPFDPILSAYTFWGVNKEASNYTAYDGQTLETALFDYYRQYELDRLNGYSFEFTHPYGDGDEVTASAESTAYDTKGVGSLSGCAPGANSAGQFAGFAYANTVTGGCSSLPYLTPGAVGSGAGAIQATALPYPGLNAPSTTIPGGASQVWNTYMIRNILNVTPKIQWIATIYENTYHNTYPNECVYTPGWYGASKNGATSTSNIGRAGAACAVDGSNVLPSFNAGTGTWSPGWITATQTHFDERTALEWRPDPQIAVRLSAGSGIAPEYLAELTRTLGYPVCSFGCSSVVINYPNPNLRPETSFGYDLGADYAFSDGDTFASVDLYSTNLFNHFITAINYSGLNCTAVNYPGSGCPAAPGVPLYYSENTNVSNARFEGVEAELKHVPAQGFGFSLSAAAEHAYPYNLSPNFYCTFTPTTAKPCIPANYNTNLNILPGENFEGNGISTGYYCGTVATPAYHNTSFPSTCSDSVNGFSNTNIPYLQGNAEINWRTQNGWWADFGSTLLGKNNSFNAPPFWITYASVRARLSSTLSIQVSGDNLFNQLPGYFEYEGTGVNYPLANGQEAASIENQLGPAVYHIELTKTFDSP